MAAEKLAPEKQDLVASGAHQAAHVDQLLALWQAKVKLSDDYIAQLAFLQKNWGRWQASNGVVVFSDDGFQPDYDSLADTIQNDIDSIRDAQRQISR